MRIAVLACLLSGVIALQPPERSSAELGPECFRPLEEFCLTDKCHAYKAELSALRGDGDCYGRATIGRRGPHRITHRSDGFSAQTRYFDKAGKLVAVRTERDTMTGNPACQTWTHYGIVTTCQVTNITQLCKQGKGKAEKGRHIVSDCALILLLSVLTAGQVQPPAPAAPPRDAVARDAVARDGAAKARTATVSGRVVDRETGQPLGRVMVTLISTAWRDQEMSSSAMTAQTGIAGFVDDSSSRTSRAIPLPLRTVVSSSNRSRPAPTRSPC